MREGVEAGGGARVTGSADADGGMMSDELQNVSNPPWAREVAMSNEILRGLVGSTAHGTAIDGQDDRDEMGIFIEPARFV